MSALPTSLLCGRQLRMSYAGGKGASGAVQNIINRIPPARTIISLFGGNCALLRTIKPAPCNMYIEIDPDVAKKFEKKSVIVFNRDALIWLQNFIDTGYQNDAFIYADPPYVPSTLRRPHHSTRNTQRYRYKFGVEAHETLLKLLDLARCNVMISGYDCSLYARQLTAPKWFKHDFQAMTRRGKRTESLWMNYDPDQLTHLHDYRFIGKDYRAREIFKKRKATILNKFGKLNAIEKNAVLELLKEKS